MGSKQRRVFIFGALDYYKLGALLEDRSGRSHIFIFDSAPVPKCLKPDAGRVRKIFKFENLTPVQTPATMDATDIQQCLYLGYVIYENQTDSCC